MKVLLFSVGILTLSWCLLLLRERLAKPPKISLHNQPVFLTRFDDGKWGVETDEESESGDMTRKLVLRIKLPAQKDTAFKGSDFRLYVKGDSNEISKW